MKGFFNLIFIMVFGWLGWKIGLLFGGIMTAYFVSGAGSLLGIYVGWKIGRRILE